MSIYQYLGIPEPLAMVFAIVTLSLSLVPVAAGADFGPIKIPQLANHIRSRLRVVGPVALALVLLGFFPVLEKRVDVPAGAGSRARLADQEVRPIEEAMRSHVRRALVQLQDTCLGIAIPSPQRGEGKGEGNGMRFQPPSPPSSPASGRGGKSDSQRGWLFLH